MTEDRGARDAGAVCAGIAVLSGIMLYNDAKQGEFNLFYPILDSILSGGLVYLTGAYFVKYVKSL